MFSWFDYPFVRPTRYVYRTPSIFDSFFDDDFDDFFFSPLYRTPRYYVIRQAPEDTKTKDTKETKTEEKTDNQKSVEKTQTSEKPITDQHSEQKNEEKVDETCSKCQKCQKSDKCEPKSFTYTSRMMSYIGSDGVEHTKKEVSDSRTGVTTTIETRKIGDKAMTLHREVAADGTVTQHETLSNLDMNEVEEFKQKWEQLRGTTTQQKSLDNSSSKQDNKEDNKEEKKESIEHKPEC